MPSVLVVSCASEEAVSAALQLAIERVERRPAPLRIIGVAMRRPWLEAFAPMSGQITSRQMRHEALADTKLQVTACLEQLPDGVAVTHACCTGWTDPALRRLLADGVNDVLLIACGGRGALPRRVGRMLRDLTTVRVTAAGQQVDDRQRGLERRSS